MDDVFYLLDRNDVMVGTVVQEEDHYQVSWNDGEDTASTFDNLAEMYNSVMSQGIQVVDFNDRRVQRHLQVQSLEGIISRHEENMEDLKRQVKETEAKVEKVQAIRNEDVKYLMDALCKTMDHIGSELLPPVEGWPWFDAMMKYRPERAIQWQDAYGKHREQETQKAANSTEPTWYMLDDNLGIIGAVTNVGHAYKVEFDNMSSAMFNVTSMDLVLADIRKKGVIHLAVVEAYDEHMSRLGCPPRLNDNKAFPVPALIDDRTKRLDPLHVPFFDPKRNNSAVVLPPNEDERIARIVRETLSLWAKDVTIESEVVLSRKRGTMPKLQYVFKSK